MGRGGDPEGRPFDWLADIKLNNGLTLARRLYYYQQIHTHYHTLQHVHTDVKSTPGQTVF